MNKPEHKLIGQSESFLQVLEHASRLTHLNRPVLVVGERGTGKELIAERLHYLSDRWAKPLLKMNCAAVHETLLESELFGHEAGAFTGATKRHLGRFERANGGTLFLDELATMSMATQEKLLRIIEYGEFERLGGSETQTVDTRLVAATNLDLPTLAEQGKFRYDLLDRLAFDVITLPPLRARQEDILVLAEHFAIKMCKELQRPFFGGFNAKVKNTLIEYSWPGNIRELKNVIERAVHQQENNEQTIEHLTFDPFASPYRPAKTATESRATANPTAATSPPASAQLPVDYQKCRAAFERNLLEQALAAAHYNQKEAAQLLGLTYHQLRNQLKKHQLLPA